MATPVSKKEIINRSPQYSFGSGRRSSHDSKSPRNVKGIRPLISIEMLDSEESQLIMAHDPLD